MDRRVKGCPNEKCICNIKRIKQKPDNEYCPKCGTKLIFVCEKCFTEIEDLGKKHRICKSCEAKADLKKKRVKEKAISAGGKAAGATTVICSGVATAVSKDGGKQLIKVGSKIAEGAVKVILRK